MSNFKPYDLGRVLANVEAVRAVRSNVASDELQRAYLGERRERETTAYNQQQQNAASAQQRAGVEWIAGATDRLIQQNDPNLIPVFVKEAVRRGVEPAEVNLTWDDVKLLNQRSKLELGVTDPHPEPLSPQGKIAADRESGILSPEEAGGALRPSGEASPFGKVDAGAFTPESLAAFQKSGDYSVLRSTDENDGPRLFDQAAKLRAEFNSQSSDFRGATQGYQNVLSASAEPSAAGDIALIFSYMKTLDPGSTVREGEFATAQNSGSVPDRITAQYNKILQGERLAPDQRQDFVAQATRLYKGQLASYHRLEERYGELSTRAGIDPADVVGKSLGIEPNDGAAGPLAAPKVGAVQNGYRFKGGDPAQQASWEKL